MCFLLLYVNSFAYYYINTLQKSLVWKKMLKIEKRELQGRAIGLNTKIQFLFCFQHVWALFHRDLPIKILV